MTSEKQIQANQENAQKSTGPKDTGKTRFNAVKHGLRCTFRLLADENPEEFSDRLILMLRDYEARGPVEVDLVTRIVEMQWVQNRALYEEACVSEDSDTSDEADLRRLRISEYRKRAENTMFRCMRELRMIQRERGKAPRIPLADEEFFPRHLHATEEETAAFHISPPPQFPEKPTKVQFEREAMVHQIKIVYNSPNFDASKWPADAVRQADLELGLGDFPFRWSDPGNDQAQAS